MLPPLTGDHAARLHIALRRAGRTGAHSEPADPMVTAALPVIRGLVRHGMPLPAGLA